MRPVVSRSDRRGQTLGRRTVVFKRDHAAGCLGEVPIAPVAAIVSLEPLVPPLDDPLDMPLVLPGFAPELRAFSRAMQASRCEDGTLAQSAVASLARLAGTRSTAPVEPVAALPEVLPVTP